MNLALPLRDYRTPFLLTGLSTSLVAAVLLSLATGAVSIPVNDVALIFLHKLGLFQHVPVDDVYDLVLTSIRLPRILMTVLIGASLGVSGAALQALFRNPLVEPSLIGVSGGSASAVVLVIVFGGAWAIAPGHWLYNSVLQLTAFGGGIVATFIVLRLSSQLGQTNIAVLILSGVALNALSGAIIGLAIFYADENQLRTFTFWTLGDLGGATWDKLLVAGPLLVGSCVALLFFAPALNVLALGEAEAYHSGANVERVKKQVIALTALAVGISVSLSGIIGFIGLVVPHVIRLGLRPDNRLVLPASVLGGALLLVLADIVARTVVTPSELPIGVVTALVGAPFFIGLLLRAKRKHEL
ncbi:FecCD family ABC transporter permease [Chryseolinea lacunae]|uniref:Iron ABC transporter permease n=1 Tax=Chryseolinea lacunae TaxID=2801331 RepID=A0ABS1KYM8_9BACT|nr:iron ABC transporter permease [Chryseolinea lacunae]MBL0744383.1 iron ABC transporter permease [Chryseolinea lacunae]